MNTNELMIGDWVVSTLNKAVYQIDPILAYGITDAVLKNDPDIDNHFEPIPLTQEILEKNGFKLKREDVSRKCLCGEFGNKISIVYIIKHKRFHFYHDNHKFLNLRIKYVHELQHALRLCKLNELAGKFEV